MKVFESLHAFPFMWFLKYMDLKIRFLSVVFAPHEKKVSVYL